MNENNPYINNETIQHNQKKTLREEKVVEIIKKEMKKRNFFLNFFTIFFIFVFIAVLTLLILSFLVYFEKLETKEWIIPTFLLKLWFTIPIFIINLPFLFFFIFNRYRFLQEKKIYYQKEEEFDLQRVPNFIVSKYKNYLTIRIFVNWFSIPIHIFFILLISTISLWFFKYKEELEWALKKEFFESVEEFWKTNFLIEVNEENGFLIGICVGWAIIIILQIIINFILMRKKVNIEILFDLKQKIDFGEIRSYTRKMNLFAFLFICLPILFGFLIYKILKRIKK